MTEVSDTLRKALALIEKPENWCKGAYERDKDGRDTLDHPDSGPPCQWCIEGALERVAFRGWDVDAAIHAIARAWGANPDTFYIPIFNDHPLTDHPMVIDALTRAIAEEEANG